MTDKKLEELKSVIESGDVDQAMKIAQGYADSRVNQALTKYAESDQSEPLQEPTQADVEKQELAAEIERLKAEHATAQRKNLATDFLSKRGLPAELADFTLADDEESTIQKANQLATAIDAHLKNVRTAGAGKAVPATGTKNPEPAFNVRNMSAADIAKNWDSPDFQKQYTTRR